MKCNSHFSVPSMLQFGLWWTDRDGWCSIRVRVHGKIPDSRSSPLCRAHAELISRGYCPCVQRAVESNLLAAY